MAENYCEWSKPLYEKYEQTADKNCDATLFTSLHGLACDYVTVTQFESLDEPGKMCRRPGCICYDNWNTGLPGSSSGFSKDQAAGLQLHLAYKPNKSLASRITKYGNNNFWIVCDGDSNDVIVSQCLMSKDIVERWGRLANMEVTSPLFETTIGPATHIDALMIISEYKLYGGISDYSLAKIINYARVEPNNLLFQALRSRFENKPLAVEIETRAMEKWPRDRLPTVKDYCEPYLNQRPEMINGEVNPDWLPCTDKKTHFGTDLLMVWWVLRVM